MLKPNSLTAYISWLGLIGLIILVTTTSPVDKISYAMLFFGLLLLFLISLGHQLQKRFKPNINARDNFRLAVICLGLVSLLMFQSAQSLGWVEGSVLLAVVFGLWFYI